MAGNRVIIADPDLSAAVDKAATEAGSCRASVARAFGVPLRGDVTWLAGDLAVCRSSGATSYVRRSVPGTAYACPTLADVSRAERMIYVLHEELHLAGVVEGHGADGKDEHQVVNAAIVRACWPRSAE